MEIDRSRFLLLTAALTMAACNNTKTEAKSDAKDASAADKKAAEPAADKKAEEPAAAEPAPEPESKAFGIKGAPEPGADGDALPPVVPEPEGDSAPSPLKE